MKNRVRIIAPAGRLKEIEPTMSNIVSFLTLHDFIVSIQEDIFSAEPMPYTANTKELRQKGLKDALLDPNVDIIWAVRGGYGCSQIVIDLIDIKPVSPKILIGFSDITMLHHLFNCFYHLPVNIVFVFL